MNNFIKLPLFLGVVGAICGGVLTFTYYVTKDKIAYDEYIRVNSAFLEHFNDFNKKNIVNINDDLKDAGIENKYYVYNNNLDFIGTVYKCSVVGYAGVSNPIKFTVSYDKNGKENHFVILSHSETNQGKKFLEWLSDDKLSSLEMGKVETGSTITFNAVKKVIDICNEDVNSLINIPKYEESKDE